MSDHALNSRSWKGWSFHPGAGTPKHGPTLDKPQSKVWRAYDHWWALLVRPQGSERPELAIFELEEDDQHWRDTGIVVSTDLLATADSHFDGTDLWVATRAPGVGVALHHYSYEPDARRWIEDDRGSWQYVGVETPSVSVCTNNDRSVWVSFTQDSLPVYATASFDRFPHLDHPQAVPKARATLIGVDLTALVEIDDGMGLMWSDQTDEAFYFAILSPDGTWHTEVAASGGRVADDHIAIRSFEGRLYVAIKTSKDDPPDHAPDEPLIALLVREPNGFWHMHTVVTADIPVTRPIPLVDEVSRAVHVFYTRGSNPGERAIHRKSASLEELSFEAGPGSPVIAYPGAEINDVTSARVPINQAIGAVLLASDGMNREYFFCRIKAEAP